MLFGYLRSAAAFTRIAVPCAALGLLLATAAAAAAAPAPGAPASAPETVFSDDPDALRSHLMEHRIAEAEAKERRADEWMRSELQRAGNQADFNVSHYDLDLILDPSTNTLSGTVTATLASKVASLTSVDLNLTLGMTVSAATAGGAATTWSHPASLLTVDLDQAYGVGQVAVVSVTYSGNPAGDSFGWSSFDGADMIWTLSEPTGARDWWPCKDLNGDKADSLDMRATVPDPLVVASNGLLQSTTPAGAGWTTYHWKTTYPIVPYLVSLAIHPYSTFSHTYTPLGGGSMPVDYYVFPSHFSSVQATYALTVPMLETFAAGYGEYPFVNEKYGHAEFTWGGGMEHQTLSSMGGWSEDLISHELAHQWWGDMVTCRSFNHIWLNEGFATWSEAYWKEQSDGFGTYQSYMDAAAYYGPGTIIVEMPAIEDIFDVNLTYNKASWVPHMLRHVVGDANFFAGLAYYRAQHEYSGANTDNLRDDMEFVSGMDLDAFFQQWIYGEYYPVYRPSWSVTTPGTVDLTIEQVQANTGLFTMPIDVRVATTTGTFDFVVQNSLASEAYALSVTGDVESVQIDPDRWILREVETFVTNPTFDAGILVVNGVDWDVSAYQPDLNQAYQDSVFWADLPFTFWDTFPEPAGGYPANLPVPAGHGPVLADLLGKYSSVVWVGNNYNGDLPKWIETPIESYLGAGGNVLLLTRQGNSFLDGSLESYLGITINSTGVTLNNMTAVDPSMVDVALTGAQNLNDVFSPTVGPNSTLLLQSSTDSGLRGSGVIVEPPGGGTHRAEGGKFAYVAGRPYRMNRANLRDNVETILKSFFGEPYSGAIDSPVDVSAPVKLALGPGMPNPFRQSTRIAFTLPEAGVVDLSIYDVTGRLVRTLSQGRLPAGAGEATWDGTDTRGRRSAAGVYFVRLRAEDDVRTRPIVRLR